MYKEKDTLDCFDLNLIEQVKNKINIIKQKKLYNTLQKKRKYVFKSKINWYYYNKYNVL